MNVKDIWFPRKLAMCFAGMADTQEEASVCAVATDQIQKKRNDDNPKHTLPRGRVDGYHCVAAARPTKTLRVCTTTETGSERRNVDNETQESKSASYSWY